MTLKKISMDAFKSDFDEILRSVEMGESFRVVGEGELVVDIVPARTGVSYQAHVAISNILKMKKHSISDQKLSFLKGSGRL